MFPRLSTLALAVLACLPLACKSTEGHDRAAATAEQVVEVGGLAGQTQLRLDNALNALEQVVATKDQNPKLAFDTFAKEYEAFGDELADLTRERGALQSKSEAWFAEFEKQNAAISDADLRAAGAQRLSEFRAQIGEISQQVDGLLTDTKSVQGRLGDVRTYLGNDLTAPGIAAVADKVGALAKDGRKVASSLGQLSRSSASVADKLRAAQKPPQQG